MVRQDGKRNFVLRDESGDTEHVYTGNTPRQAALKAARRLPAAPSEEEIDGKAELRLREKTTQKVHIYDGWAWQEEKPDDGPEWMPDVVTRANVSKQGIEHLE
ncbi:nucleoid protein MC1 [Halogranum gelatinilyticum]|jgi:hypothetical protein|uniref:Nucleoid protein MC1 n=1 Tax=Halogranum gelatinilyticum TaxID=660521 RepID=A0A1G9QTP1_9EURY|nr:non-histone chromosomal MC1 family protein [Halogranum gelatinilyticum]SDM14366.1 nucleoid protein MC1 [Halogranum gelatinilyticum]